MCGVRRGRGAGTKVEAAFEERHRPWDGDGRWAVEVRLLLDDGRTIEISQDLAGKVACRATDVVLGRDVSDEILDGTPDASRWLGLDREAFAATICVGQAQIAAIAGRETAASLQEHMQRAAATRGTDATAAEARMRLDEFRREHVGVDRQGARGPLRSAKERVELARGALDDARTRHEAFLDATLSAEAAERAASSQARQAATIEAALAGRASAELTRRTDRAAELAARYPTEPAGAADRDMRADAVAGALDAWLGRPRAEPLTGTSAAELEAQLASLPAAPDGDIEVDPSVLGARRALDRADDAIGMLGPRPAAPAPDAMHGPGEDELRSLARRLRTSDPDLQPHLEEELRSAEQELAGGGGRRGLAWGLAAAFSTLVAVAAVIAGQPLLAVLALALAVGLGVRGWLAGRTPASAAARRVELARAAVTPQFQAREAARAERDAAAEDARAAGLPADSDDLERRADVVAAAIRAARDVEAWDARRGELEARRAQASGALLEALRARGVETDGREGPEAMAAYEAACRQRAEAARRAAGRPALEQALATRREAEAAAAETASSVERAERALRAAAADVGLDADGTADELAESLASWRSAKVEQAERSDLARREWHELTTLLDGRPLEMLRADSDAAAASGRVPRREGRPRRAHRPSLSRDDLTSLLEVEREELARAREVGQRAAWRTRRDAARPPRRCRGRGGVGGGGRRAGPRHRPAGGARGVDAPAPRRRGTGPSRPGTDPGGRDHALAAASQRRSLHGCIGRSGRPVGARQGSIDRALAIGAAALRGHPRADLPPPAGWRWPSSSPRPARPRPSCSTRSPSRPMPSARPQLLGVLHELSAERQIILFTHDDDVIDWADADPRRAERSPRRAASRRDGPAGCPRLTDARRSAAHARAGARRGRPPRRHRVRRGRHGRSLGRRGNERPLPARHARRQGQRRPEHRRRSSWPRSVSASSAPRPRRSGSTGSSSSTSPTARCEPTLALRERITRAIRELRPEVVMTHDPTVLFVNNEWVNHPDHRAVGQATVDAVFPTARDPLNFREHIEAGLEAVEGRRALPVEHERGEPDRRHR